MRMRTHACAMLEDHITITNNHEYKKDTSNIKFSLTIHTYKHLNLFLKHDNPGIREPGVRVLTYHLHAHTLGPIAKEEEPLRHTMNNHLKGIATLDMHLHAVALDFAPQGYPWIAPGNRLRDVGRSVGTGKKPTARIMRNRPDGCLHVYPGGGRGCSCRHDPAVLYLEFLPVNGKERVRTAFQIRRLQRDRLHGSSWPA